MLLKGLPLSAVEDLHYRKFRGSNATEMRKLVRKSTFIVVSVVERKIGVEMKKVKRGSTMHNGWSEHRSHCTGLFSRCVRPTKQTVNGKLHAKCVSVVVLLAVSPIIKLSNEKNGKLIKILL